MAARHPIQLFLRNGDQCSPLASLCRTPVLVGRDEGCHVVVREPAVSRHHLLIWARSGHVLVRDLGSTLGTRAGTRQLGPGDATVVQFGEDIVLGGRTTVYWSSGGGEIEEPAPLAIVAGEGSGEVDPMRVTGVWEDTIFDRAGRTAALLRPPAACVDAPAALTITLGPSGPLEARVETEEGADIRVRGEARVVMLYLLGTQVLRCEGGMAESSWVEDRSLLVGLWEARGVRLPPSRLNTLISRVRAQLRKGGASAQLIEKDSGSTRLSDSIVSVVIEAPIDDAAPTLLPSPAEDPIA